LKNTIITSISAIVFLVIGLFIGKSNKQIEIQTVAKTNIVEKPVIEYVDKYVTNVVEKVLQAEIPEEYVLGFNYLNKSKSAKFLRLNELPKSIKELSVSVSIANILKETVSDKVLTDYIEFELRKIGIKVNKKSKYSLSFTIDAQKDEQNKLIFHSFSLNVTSPTYCFAPDGTHFIVVSKIWDEASYGILGYDIIDQKTFNNYLSDKMFSLCNQILASREKE